MEFESRQPDEIFKNLKQKFSGYQPKGFWFPLIVGFFILLTLLGAGGLSFNPFYTIQPNEVGVLLRFGRFIETTSPGLHLKWPLIEKVIPVKVEYVYKEEFGFRTTSAGVKTVYSQKSYNEEALLLTGDLNVVNLEWIVQFKIKDPYQALFKIRNVTKTLRDISESVMRKVVGDHTFDEVLTQRKEMGIGSKVHKAMQKILDSYETGVHIVTVKVQNVTPPPAVKPAFSEVNEARQEREKLVNQAWQVYNQKIPEAKGEALKMVKEAEGYALEKVNRAKGDAKRFILMHNEYRKAKAVTLKRIYLDKMDDILQKAGKKYILDPKEKGILPLLKLNEN